MLQLQSLLNFPTGKCFGLLLAEIESLNKVLNNSKKAGNGCSRWVEVSSKITVIENILDKVDHILWWRNDLYFRKALGGKIGDSICETTNKN
jgi:phosphoglycerate kinase